MSLNLHARLNISHLPTHPFPRQPEIPFAYSSQKPGNLLDSPSPFLLISYQMLQVLPSMFQILPPFLHHFHHLPPVLEQLISQSQVPSLSFSLPSLHVRLVILNKISDLTLLKFEIPECPPHPFIALSISPHCLACHAKP